jgi:S-DNA-T family DNA segregation ATPase FtsK/SpoIIIE
MPNLMVDTAAGAVRLGPSLSIFDPVYFGIDEFGFPFRVPLIERGVLLGGAPGAGKSTLLNLIVAHAALSLDCRLCLFDGKRVELSQWKACADVFVGPDIQHALRTLRRLQTVMDNRYTYLESVDRRKIANPDVFTAILIAIDELAYFSATVGD